MEEDVCGKESNDESRVHGVVGWNKHAIERFHG